MTITSHDLRRLASQHDLDLRIRSVEAQMRADKSSIDARVRADRAATEALVSRLESGLECQRRSDLSTAKSERSILKSDMQSRLTRAVSDLEFKIFLAVVSFLSFGGVALALLMKAARAG